MIDLGRFGLRIGGWSSFVEDEIFEMRTSWIDKVDRLFTSDRELDITRGDLRSIKSKEIRRYVHWPSRENRGKQQSGFSTHRGPCVYVYAYEMETRRETQVNSGEVVRRTVVQCSRGIRDAWMKRDVRLART